MVNKKAADKKAKPAKVKQVKQDFHDPLWELYYKYEAKIMEKKGTIINTFIGVLAVLVVGGVVVAFFNYRKAKGQEAMAGALEIYNAPVVKPEEVKDAKTKVYTDAQQKYKEAATAFDAVASAYSEQAQTARFYAAISRIHFDQPKAQAELEALSKESGDLGFWAKLALAESYTASGQYDKALASYNQMKDSPGQLTKALMLYNIGTIYELQGKRKEAADAYFQSASAARSSSEGRKAASRLEALDAELFKKLPEEKPTEGEI